MPIGAVLWFAGDVIPENYLPCWGSDYLIADYPELYAVIGDVFNNPSTPEGYFAVPELASRFPVGTSEAYTLGDKGGEATHTLTTGELPAHTHSVVSHSHTIPNMSAGTAQGGSTTAVWSRLSGTMASGSASPATSSVGSGEDHENRPPYIALNPIIRYR